MSTTKQKAAARKNLEKARAARSAKAKGRKAPAKRTRAMSTAQQNDLRADQFAFPEQRKEPLVDAKHVRNAVSRFDQVEGVTDAERDRAWRRVRAAAKKFDVEISATNWRQLAKGGKDRRSATR